MRETDCKPGPAWQDQRSGQRSGQRSSCTGRGNERASRGSNIGGSCMEVEVETRGDNNSSSSSSTDSGDVSRRFRLSVVLAVHARET